MTHRSESGPAPRILVIDRDGELAARIRHDGAGAGAVVKGCPDTGRAETHLAAAHWDAVVAGPSVMHRAGLSRLASLHGRYPWVATVLALSERPRADLAEIVQVGASDIIPLHADDDDLRRTLARAVRLTRSRIGVMIDGAGAASRGRIVMVSSASGGCGKTFLATNAAAFLARTTDQPVVLLDLDLQFGEVSTALRLRPEATITDALAAEAEGFDLEDILDGFLLTHPDGFRVLAAPRLPAEADSVTPGDVTRILDVLRARRAWVVIDTHEGLSDLFVAALEATDHVFALATPDRPSLLNLGRYLGELERLGMTAENISIVLNKAEADTRGLHQPPPRHGQIDPVDMAAQLGRRFEAMVPYSRDVLRSVNVGVPLVVGKPKSRVTTLLTTALSAVLRSRTTAPAPVARVPVPEPVVDLTEPAGARDELPEDGGHETDLLLPPTRACSAMASARPMRRCRRLPERLSGGPCRDRGPPRLHLSRPDPPRAAGRSCIPRRCDLRPPLSRPQSIWVRSYPALVRSPRPNGPRGL